MAQTVRREKTVPREQRVTPVKKVILVLKDLKAIKAILDCKDRKAKKAQRETRGLPERLALTVKVLTPLLRPVATRTPKPISMQTLPQCKDLRRRLQLYKEVDI